MPFGGLLTVGLIGGGALVGGLAGSMKDKSTQNYTSGLNMAPASSLETQGQNLTSSSLGQLESLVNAGAGTSDVSAGSAATRDFAEMLRRYAQQGGNLPNQADIDSSNGLANRLFGAQRVAMTQAFDDQTTAANRQAALMGRSMNDPILRAKLAQEQTRQSTMLDAQQGAWAQQFALQQPMQRLGFMGQRADALQGLASQALANRQALAAMGSGVLQNERNFRATTAERYSNGTTESGGGLKGALTGGLAGAGTAASLATGIGGLGGFGGMPVGSSVAGMGGSAQFSSAANFFNGPNPYASAAPALGTVAPQQQNIFSGSSYNPSWMGVQAQRTGFYGGK